MRQAQDDDPELRSADVQREILHVELVDLKQALMASWKLPDVLVRVSDDRHVDHANVRNVMLAIRIARHSALGWDNPAIPDDVAAIAELLGVSSEPVMRLLHEIDG